MEPEAVRKIRRRTKKGEDAMQGWQRIYSIIFPDEKTIPSPYVEDIAQLYLKRTRKTTVVEFIRYVHSTLDDLSTEASPNESSIIKSACVSHLRKVADEFTRKESTEEIMSTSTGAYNIHGGSQTVMIEPCLSSIVGNCVYDWDTYWATPIKLI
jgi:FlaG/FlaF family flagellin (archaellin)